MKSHSKSDSRFDVMLHFLMFSVLQLIEQIKYFPSLDHLCVLEHRALGPKIYKAENCMMVKNLSGQHMQSVLAMEHCLREKSRQKKVCW